MGYSFSVYAVDLEKLKAVWGSADDKVKNALKKKLADDITENDETWAEQIASEGVPSTETALDDIFAGKATKRKHGFQYGYALEIICRHLGKRVDDLDMTWVDELIDPLLKKHKKPNAQKLLGSGSFPMPIPKPADFPEIGTIDAAGMTALGAALDAIEEDAEDDDDATEVIEELRGWLASAKKAKKQIVWFIY